MGRGGGGRGEAASGSIELGKLVVNGYVIYDAGLLPVRRSREGPGAAGHDVVIVVAVAIASAGGRQSDSAAGRRDGESSLKDRGRGHGAGNLVAVVGVVTTVKVDN